MRRMNALSSTIRTRGLSEDTRTLAHRAHLDGAVGDVEIDAPSIVAARVLGDDGNLCAGEHLAHGDDVSLADVDAARRNQIAEHAGAADDFRAQPISDRAQIPHPV